LGAVTKLQLLKTEYFMCFVVECADLRKLLYFECSVNPVISPNPMSGHELYDSIPCLFTV
jgi:hypothetical protein